jgi:hypothetical protein
MQSAGSNTNEIYMAQRCQGNSVQASKHLQTTEIQYAKIVNWFFLFFLQTSFKLIVTLILQFIQFI